MNIKKKSLTKFLTLTALICSAVYVALSVAYIIVTSDAVYAMTFLPIAINQLMMFCDFLTYGVCFSVFIYSIYAKGVKKSLPLTFIYGVILLAEKLIATNTEHLIYGTGWDIDGLILVLLIWLLEMLLVLAVVLIGYFCLRNKKQIRMDFDKLYSKENALQRSALILSLVISIPTIISRIIDDIIIGAPSDITEFLWIIVMYLSHIASGAIIYIVSVFVMKRLYKSENI